MLSIIKNTLGVFISPIYRSISNHPLASIAMGATIMGVAIAAIGILSLMGIVPGISSITAMCFIAGGGTMAIIGTLGLLKGFFLTNKRMSTFICKITSRHESEKIWPIEFFDAIEKKLIEKSREAANPNNKVGVYAKIFSMFSDDEVYAFYCLYNSSNQQHDWYRLDSENHCLYHTTTRELNLRDGSEEEGCSAVPMNLKDFNHLIHSYRHVTINDPSTFNEITYDLEDKAQGRGQDG